ncbi:uncharacterized protein GLRG_02372 [Colletotrichum graminicola M1.001]|uniref:Uncharacterized protein n=1 Tax=Colletotrichum graminicola (strain M1.001 / M2 / FGSC 10212) TaxID=645133 RepID=E3Q8I9_COLGM|nr:uncharacterized protein GLRG_02372 [Colletotrichum graminicola M1.001]EFQ27201.1 hypothetical protein GLRG_02372 [Colletotrichum graminicola M1.001]
MPSSLRTSREITCLSPSQSKPIPHRLSPPLLPPGFDNLKTAIPALTRPRKPAATRKNAAADMPDQSDDGRPTSLPTSVSSRPHSARKCTRLALNLRNSLLHLIPGVLEFC